MLEANVAHLAATVAKTMTSVVPVASLPSALATAVLEVSRQTVHVVRTSRPAKAILRVNAVQAAAFAAKTVASVVQNDRQASYTLK